MPRQAPDTSRCAYVENGRKCRRSGTGNPALCQAHLLVLQQANQHSGGRGEALFDLVDTWLSGGRISKKKARAAINDLRDIYQSTTASAQPSPGPSPGPQSSAPPPRPPSPPDEIELARKRFIAAKLVMGFAESEPITADMVNARRKEMARRYHPDRQGGSLEQMTKINAAADTLLATRKRKVA